MQKNSHSNALHQNDVEAEGNTGEGNVRVTPAFTNKLTSSTFSSNVVSFSYTSL